MQMRFFEWVCKGEGKGSFFSFPFCTFGGGERIKWGGFGGGLSR